MVGYTLKKKREAKQSTEIIIIKSKRNFNLITDLFFSGQLDFISIDSRENRILYFSNEADLDETLVIRKPLLKR